MAIFACGANVLPLRHTTIFQELLFNMAWQELNTVNGYA